ncbi:hypothetical protein [Streptomyces sp. NPDC047028]|uniref:hypothetical protein n=1 Tax=Streptomyces sp. NPDC047028 TaxID=3155793 RepID=UPI0033C08CD6
MNAPAPEPSRGRIIQLVEKFMGKNPPSGWVVENLSSGVKDGSGPTRSGAGDESIGVSEGDAVVDIKPYQGSWYIGIAAAPGRIHGRTGEAMEPGIKGEWIYLEGKDDLPPRPDSPGWMTRPEFETSFQGGVLTEEAFYRYVGIAMKNQHLLDIKNTDELLRLLKELDVQA